MGCLPGPVSLSLSPACVQAGCLDPASIESNTTTPVPSIRRRPQQAVCVRPRACARLGLSVCLSVCLSLSLPRAYMCASACVRFDVGVRAAVRVPVSARDQLPKCVHTRAWTCARGAAPVSGHLRMHHLLWSNRTGQTALVKTARVKPHGSNRTGQTAPVKTCLHPSKPCVFYLLGRISAGQTASQRVRSRLRWPIRAQPARPALRTCVRDDAVVLRLRLHLRHRRPQRLRVCKVRHSRMLCRPSRASKRRGSV